MLLDLAVRIHKRIKLMANTDTRYKNRALA